MIVDIKVRGDDGKYRKAWVSEYCVAVFDRIEEEADFTFLMYSLQRWCLRRAERYADRPDKADLWIERYKALRGVQ